MQKIPILLSLEKKTEKGITHWSVKWSRDALLKHYWISGMYSVRKRQTQKDQYGRPIRKRHQCGKGQCGKGQCGKGQCGKGQYRKSQLVRTCQFRDINLGFNVSEMCQSLRIGARRITVGVPGNCLIYGRRLLCSLGCTTPINSV